MVIGITSSMLGTYVCLLLNTFDEATTIGDVSKTNPSCIANGKIINVLFKTLKQVSNVLFFSWSSIFLHAFFLWLVKCHELQHHDPIQVRLVRYLKLATFIKMSKLFLGDLQNCLKMQPIRGYSSTAYTVLEFLQFWLLLWYSLTDMIIIAR